MRACRIEQQPRRLEGIARNDDILGLLEVPAVFTAIVHAGNEITGRIGFDAAHHGEVADLRPGVDGTRNPGDERALFGISRAP
jgi:hypothetical protein